MNKPEGTFGVGKTVSMSELEPDFRSQVLEHPDARGLVACFGCGTCSAGCPIHDVFPEYNPKRLAKMVRLGMRKQVLSSPYIWYCATCHNCEERCPQNVKLFSVLNVLKNIAAKEGHSPPAWVEQTEQVAETGMAFPTEEKWVREREKHSLPCLRGDEKRAKKIIELAGIDKIKADVDWQ